MNWFKVVIIAAVIILLVAIFFPGYKKSQELKSRNRNLIGRMRALKAENAGLKKEIERLKEDDTYIEDIARSQMGLSKTDEIVYKIEDEGASE